MSYGGYQQYGGNPYGQSDGDNRYGAPNPYGTANPQGGTANPYGTTNPYGTATQYGTAVPYNQASPDGAANPYASPGGYGTPAGYGQNLNAPPLSHEPSNYSQVSTYSGHQPIATHVSSTAYPLPTAAPTMTNQDFLTRVEAARSEIRNLTANIAEIGTIHQRILSSPESTNSAQLENLVSQTQVLNTRIKDQIKYLEADAARSGTNVTKDSQIRTLKQSFKSQLEEYQKEEQIYRQRYRDQIARQYRIVNPEASEEEVLEAQDADWGNEGVFQTALKTNRTGAATSVLGAVRARHNDIQQIERTLIELNQLFQDLAEAVLLQDTAVQRTEEQTEHVKKDTEAGNQQLDKGIRSAKRARRLKWITFFVIVLILCILALVLGLVFGLRKAT